MSVTPLPDRPLNVEAVLDLAAGLVRGRGITPAEATDEIVANYTLDPHATAYFLREGIRSMVNRSKHGHTSAPPLPAPPSTIPIEPQAATERRMFARFQSRWAHGRALVSALDSLYIDAHGRMKPVADFLREDWQEWIHREIAQVKGHAARVRVGQDALALLDRYNAKSARDLPTTPLAQFEQAFAEAVRA